MWPQVSPEPPSTPGRRFFSWPSDALKCKECATEYPLDARYVCERCFGPLEVAYDSRADVDVAEAAAPDPGGPALDLALRATSCPFERRRRGRARRRASTPLRARRPARRAARPAARCGSRTTPPTRRTRSRTASSRSRWRKAQRARASRSSPAPRPATSPTRSPPTPPPPGLESYVFIPADLEEQKVLATGVYGTNLVAVHGNYDDVNRLCTELVGRARRGRSSTSTCARTTPRARRRSPSRSPSSSGCELPDRVVVPDRLGLAVHQDRAAASRSGSSSGCSSGDAADVQRRPGRGLLAGGAGVRRRRTTICRPVQARTRSPSRWPSATRPTAPTRSTLARRTGGGDRRRDRRRDRDGIRLLAETTGHLHRDRRRRDDRGAGQARRARRHRRRRARRASSSPATA